MRDITTLLLSKCKLQAGVFVLLCNLFARMETVKKKRLKGDECVWRVNSVKHLQANWSTLCLRLARGSHTGGRGHIN